jgi:hypothetical protein
MGTVGLRAPVWRGSEMKRQRGGRKAVEKARAALVRRVAEPEEGKGQAAHSAKSLCAST